jgi:hypothetical protein
MSVLLLVGTFPVAAPMTGCTISTAQLQADATALGTACTGLATSLQAVNPQAATYLTTAAAGLTALGQNWTGTSSEQQLNAIAAGIEAVMSTIPAAAPYAAAVSVVVAALDIILANTAAAPTANVAVAENVQAQAANNLATYRALGKKLLKHRFGRSPAGDFAAAWKLATA